MYRRHACAEAYSRRTVGMMCFNTFPLQELHCPSQATHVHNQTTQLKPLPIIISATSVVDFGHVRLRKEPVLICWTVTLGEIVDCMYGMVPTPLWSWTFPKDGVLRV